MKKIELNIVALSHSVTQTHNYAVILGEKQGSRRLPIIIGGYEAQAIAVAMEGMKPNRPLTHDLFKNTLGTFDVDLQEVIINDLDEGIFFARLVCWKDGEVIEIDSRTSDALALAVRFDCPIFTYEFIMDAAGVVLEEPEEGEEPIVGETAPVEESSAEEPLSAKSLPQLKELLDDVLNQENYERAAEIRDEINRRKGEES